MSLLNKLIFTALRGRMAAVYAERGRIRQIEFFPSQAEEEIGTVYIGRVRNIVKNIQAAFVEYRPGVNGYYSLTENRKHLYADGQEHKSLKEGDLILVQVSRSAVKTKDAVLTSRISLAGTYSVYIAGGKQPSINLSRKILDPSWKKQVREWWEKTVSGDGEIIIRTNAYDADFSLVEAELKSLKRRYEEICRDGFHRVCFSVLFRPESFALRAVRGLRQNGQWEIVTDNRELYGELITAGAGEIPVRLYEDEAYPLAALYSLETNLNRALGKTVWLKSGGYLVIEPTEAMTVIDVNTGKTTGKKTAAETYFKTNLEAAEEIAVQMRLRNLSGIILVDFIDMKTEEEQKALMKAMQKFLDEDPVRAVAVDITALGLAELTRKKVNRPLYEQVEALRTGSGSGKEKMQAGDGCV